MPILPVPHPDEAWAWVKYLGSADCQDVVADEAVVFPAVKSSLVKAEKAFTAKGYDTSAFTVQVDDGTTGGTGSTGVYDKANDQINALFTND